MKLASIRKRAIEGLEVGDAFEVSRIFTRDDVDLFEAISRDHNPIHSSPAFASSKGFGGTICHGLLVASMLTEIGGQLGWLASGMDLRFRKPVYPGDEITCRWEITSLSPDLRAEAQVRFTNRSGDAVIEAAITGRVPNRAEREIMASLEAGRLG
ncbi:MAG: MaoC family dehydratase [Myxococcales bacterium]|nr:MAG: MaoC family dehydratase [Myxococcales bacterium]